MARPPAVYTGAMSASLFGRLDDDEALLFEGCAYPWEAIARLGETLARLLPPGVVIADRAVVEGAVLQGDRILVSEEAAIEPGAVILDGPVFVGPGARVRAGAYVRGPAFVGRGAIVGHATEVKNGILLARARAPHFNYVGDSILGHEVNLGAGSILSNFRLDGRSIKVTWEGRRLDTGLRKLGALVGDGASIGCNVVCNPGTILLPGTLVAPVRTVSGTVEGQQFLR